MLNSVVATACGRVAMSACVGFSLHKWKVLPSPKLTLDIRKSVLFTLSRPVSWSDLPCAVVLMRQFRRSVCHSPELSVGVLAHRQ